MASRAEIHGTFQTSTVSDGLAAAISSSKSFTISARGRGALNIKISVGGSEKTVGTMTLNPDVTKFLTVALVQATSPNTATQSDKTTNADHHVFYSQMAADALIEIQAQASGTLSECAMGGTANNNVGVDALFASTIVRTGQTASTASAMKSSNDDNVSGSIVLAAAGRGHLSVIQE